MEQQLIDRLIENKRDKTRSNPAYQEWMSNWLSYDVQTFSSGIPIVLVICWHPDMTPFYVSSSIDDAIAAFTKYPYEG